jgi:GGDEF domain-containing protein
LISIRKAANELDRLEAFNRAAVNCYAQAIGSTGLHALEFDAAHLARFRAQLRALKDRLQNTAEPGQLQEVQDSFDGDLKDYQGKTQDQIRRLRKDFEAAKAAVEEFTAALSVNSSDLEKDLTRELDQLEKVATSDSLTEVRNGIHSATKKIAASVEQMRVANLAAIAQMKDEIRLLHEEVKAVQALHPEDAGGVAGNRQPAHPGVHEFASQGAPFSVLLAVVKNLEGMQTLYSPNVVEDGLRSFEARLQSILPPTAVIERRGKQQFAAILTMEPAATLIAMSNDVAKKLSPPFVEQERGVAHTLWFNASVGVLEYRPGIEVAKFESKLKQLADALAS